MLLLKLRCIQGQAERGSHRMYCPPVRLTLSLRLQSRVAEKPLLVVSKGENISDLHGVSGTSEPLSACMRLSLPLFLPVRVYLYHALRVCYTPEYYSKGGTSHPA